MKKNFEKTCPICGNPIKWSKAKTCSKSCSLIKRWNKPGGLWRNKEWLIEQYFKNKFSFAKIGKIAGCRDKTVQHFFKKFGLNSRSTILGLKGKNNPRWIGGRVYDQGGYIRIFHPKPHIFLQNNKYVLEHILVMEEKLGRSLIPPEMVHHLNGIKDDNHPENLKLMSNRKEHINYEWIINIFAKQIMFGKIAPHLKDELQLMFNQFISSSLVKER